MIGTYASAILISVVAVLVGRGISVLAGHDGSTWLSPAVGFAALMVICDVAIVLPGRGWTAVAAVVIASTAAVWICARRGAPWPPLAEATLVGVVVLVIVSIPFVANGRVGVLGIGFLNDTHWHLLLAEGLRRPAIHAVDYGVGYPLGPHAVAATFAQGLGSDVDKTLTGVLIATPILTGLAALGMLADVTRPRRWLVAVLSAVPYLVAAWYIQSAFKEPILALLLVGLVLIVQYGRHTRFARPVSVVIPVAVLIAGILYDYSYPGLLWPVAIVGCWLVLELLLGGAWRRFRPIAGTVRKAWPVLALGAVVLAVLVAPDIGRIHAFWVDNGGTSAGTVGGLAASPLANLVLPLRALEGLNIWLTGDFRFLPPDVLEAGVLAGFALIVLVFAIVSALERRDFPWLGAVMAFALIYVYAKHTQTPYVAAKALVIPASLLVLGSGGALMRRVDRGDWSSLGTLAIAGASVLFFYFTFYSSYLVLRFGSVGPDNHLNELRALRPILHDRPTLVLFFDDYFQWELLGVPASSPLLPSVIPSSVQPARPWAYGNPLYFNSVDAATLNRFDYVITTRSSAGSVPPSNFRLVGGSRSYQVWRRVGPTRPYSVLPTPGNQPGAVLDCHTATGRNISRERGVAMVAPKPSDIGVGPLLAGGSEQIRLQLPAGKWGISLPFVSAQAVTVSGGGLHSWLPPNSDRPGSLWPVGSVLSTGAPIILTLKMSDPGLIFSPSEFFAPLSLVAVPATGHMTVPLRAACGRYVDWYELN